MDEVWQRAVEAAAIEGQSEDPSSPLKTLTLDSAAKCLHGRLPPPELLERFQSLEHLSIANVGVSSLENFPRLRCLRQLILSDNRIAGGLDFLVEAGLDSLRDLDLSNNRIQFAEELAPLSRFRLVSLDLYECPVTRIGGYRSRVFAMIRSLKYLDKMDADENERPETDDEEEEEEDDDDEEDEEDDPGCGEVDGDDRSRILENGVASGVGNDGILDVDEDDESDADEEETETVRVEGNGILLHNHISNGYRLAPVGEEEDEEEDDEVDDDDDGDDEDLEEDIDEEVGEDVVEVHDVGDSDDEEDIDEEEEPLRVARVMSLNGEIDGHEQGEEDENEEIDEEDEQVVDDDQDLHDDGEAEYEVEDAGGEYVVRHNDQGDAEAERRDLNPCNGEDEDVVDDNGDDENGNGDENIGFHIHRNSPSSSLQPSKRMRLDSNSPNDDIVQDLSKHH